MSHELPIACTLGATDFAARARLIAELARDALLNARHGRTQAALWFSAGADIRERVDSFVASESSCCAFLTMRVAEDGDALLLTIDAPPDAAPVLAEMVAAFGSGAPRAG